MSLRDHLVELANLAGRAKPDGRFIATSFLIAGAGLCLGGFAVMGAALLAPAAVLVGDVMAAKTIIGFSTLLAGVTGGLAVYGGVRGAGAIAAQNMHDVQECPNTRYLGRMAPLLGGVASAALASHMLFAQLPEAPVTQAFNALTMKVTKPKALALASLRLS